MNKRLTGQVALVTGGGRGIGRAIAEALASEGAAVMVVARSDAQLKEVVLTIESEGGRAAYVTCDVTDPAAVANAVSVTEKTFGPITFLVNNAGQGGPFGPVGVVDVNAWWRAQAVLVRGPMLFMTHVVPGMKERRKGRVLNVCSLGGVMGTPSTSAYGVGKAAEIALSERVDLEAKEFGVRVFPIQPGLIITDMMAETLNDVAAQTYVPGMLDVLRGITTEHSDYDLNRCTEYVVRIAAGELDAVAGRYIDFANDLDLLAKSGSARGEATPDQLTRNKELVLAFYEAAINKKNFDLARMYMSPTYKQHNPMADTGPEGLRVYIDWFKKEFPNAQVEIKQVIAEGDRVVLHCKGVNGPAPNGAAIVDIFRIENGLVAEHWDVIQAIPDGALNSNSMF